jgi:hypothetical protein
VATDVQAFIERYDKDVRRSMSPQNDFPGLVAATYPSTGPSRLQTMSPGRIMAGIADYLVAFGPNGRARDAWLIAKWPDALPVAVSREQAMRFRAAVQPNEDNTRYAHITLILDDDRYEMRGHCVIGAELAQRDA